MACPVCRSMKFYIKDPDDAYETYDFEYVDGDICFEDDQDMDQPQEVDADREIFCQKCAWHGPFKQVK